MYVNGDRRQMASKTLTSRLQPIVALQRPTSGLWLADDRRYLVMASGHADSNQVGVTKR